VGGVSFVGDGDYGLGDEVTVNLSLPKLSELFIFMASLTRRRM
jgi:hypothetical protein